MSVSVEIGRPLVSDTKRSVSASCYPLPLDPSICNIALFHPFIVYKSSILLVLLKSYKLLSDDRSYSGERPYIYTAAIILIIYVNINLWSSRDRRVQRPSQRSISVSDNGAVVRVERWGGGCWTGPARQLLASLAWPRSSHNVLRLNFTPGTRAPIHQLHWNSTTVAQHCILYSVSFAIPAVC